MTPWTRIDAAETPDGTRLELLRRGEDYSIRANGQLLMNSRIHGSEEALAEIALDALDERQRPRVLIGGLGCGYTLAAALRKLGSGARVTVVEIVPAVVRWNRELLGELNGRPLDDPRVEILERDLCDVIRHPSHSHDAVLLDVDNGPRAVARESNGWLYTPAGLAAAHAALTERGVLAVWSAGPEVGFSDRLRGAQFDVSLQRVRTRAGRRGQQHFIWLGRKMAAGARLRSPL